MRFNYNFYDTFIYSTRPLRLYKVNNVFYRDGEATMRPVSSFSCPFFLYLLSVIFTHRVIHSRLTTGDVTPLVPSSVLFLSLFFFSIFFAIPPFTRCRYSLLAACREEEVVVPLSVLAEWTGSLKVGHFGFSKSWSCMTSNFLSSSSSRPRARKGTGREERRVASM